MEIYNLKTARYGGSEQEISIWYHGTRGRNLRKILSEGLIPYPKERVWGKDDESGFNFPSRQSIGGIYVTQNLMTAMSSAGKDQGHEESRIIVILQIQPRRLIADEDAFDFHMNRAIVLPNITANEFMIADVYMSFILGTNKDYIEGVRKEYVNNATYWMQEKLKSEENQINPHPKLMERLSQILYDGWLTVLKRQVAHFSGDNWQWESVYERNCGYNCDKSQIPPKPSIAEAEDEYKKLQDSLTRTMKSISRPYVSNKEWNLTARDVEPIGYSGKNKIIGIVEIPHYPKRGIKLVYGEIPADFEIQYEQRVGPLEWIREAKSSNWYKINYF